MYSETPDIVSFPISFKSEKTAEFLKPERRSSKAMEEAGDETL